mgnify:FL=1
MGMFDDLIPNKGQAKVKSPPSSSGMFDDLIPASLDGGQADYEAALASPEGQKLAGELRTKADRELLAGAGMESPAYAALSSGINTATLNAGRNIGAGLGAVFKPERGTFEQQYEHQKAIDEAAARQNPVASDAGTVAGIGLQIAAMPTLAAETIFGRAAPTALVRGVQGAAIGGGTSGVAEFADTKDFGRAGEAALHGAGIGGALGTVGGKLEAAFAPRPSGPNELVAAAERLETPISRAAASGSYPVQQSAALLKNAAFIGDKVVQGAERDLAGLGSAVSRTADEFGTGTGQNVAHGIGETLRGAAGAEAEANRGIAGAATQDAREIAAASDELARGTADAALAAQTQRSLGRVAETEDRATRAAQGAFGNVTPEQLGATITARLRAGEQEARATKDALYAEAGRPGQAFLDRDAVQGIHRQVVAGLQNQNVIIDEGTPAAARMLRKVADVSGLRLQNMAGPRAPNRADIVGVDLAGIERTRQVLRGMYPTLPAGQPAGQDQRAASAIINEFTNAVDGAFDNGLFSGSREALDAFGAAREANRNWRHLFHNDAQEADRLLTRISTGEVTPQETANWIVGATKVGSQGASARLIDRIATATNNDPAVMQTIRGGIWNRLTQTAEGVDARNATKVANDIHEFLNGSGGAVSRRVFTEQQRRVATIYADAVRSGATAREEIATGARAIKTDVTKVADIKPNIGPLEDLAKTVLGSGGGRTDEAIFNALDGYSRSGARGDLQTLAKIAGLVPQEQKGALAGALIRKMGVSARGANDFSGDVWLTNWKNITPQAKAILFGNAGKLRSDLDDIATLSSAAKTQQKFANPSGTGRQASGAILLTGLIHSPLTTIAAVVGGRTMAGILSTPATASSMAKWARAYDLTVRKPGSGIGVALRVASRNLTNTIRGSLGENIDPSALQPQPLERP